MNRNNRCSRLSLSALAIAGLFFSLQAFAMDSKLMMLDDLRLDYASLKGTKVKVRAHGAYIFDTFYIRNGPTDLNPLIVNISNVSRDQRRQALQQCGDSRSDCIVTVTGAVGVVDYQPGIIAERIDF